MAYAFATLPDPLEALRVPGFLFWEPSALTNESTWGTKLGFVEKGVLVKPKVDVVLTYQEEYGSEPREAYFAGDSVSVKAILKNWNATVLARCFPGHTSSTQVKFPNTILPGTRIDDVYGGHLLFVPEDTVSNPICLCQRAISTFNGELLFSLSKQTDLEIDFTCMRKTDDADGLWYWGPIASGVIR